MSTAHEGLRAHIAEQLARLRQPDTLADIALELSAAMAAGAPKKTGVMAEALAEVGSPEQTGEGWKIGVGDLKLLGKPEDKAPPGTIAAFLMSDEGKQYRTRNVSAIPGWEKRKAWEFLSNRGRQALQEQRQMGLYGGPAYMGGGPARYYYVQSQDKPEWAQSAYGAGLEEGPNVWFTNDILNGWRVKAQQRLSTFFRGK